MFWNPGWVPEGGCICRSMLRRPIAVCPSSLVHTNSFAPNSFSFFAMAYSGCRPRSRAWKRRNSLFKWFLGWVKKIVEIQSCSSFCFLLSSSLPPYRPSLVFITILIHYTPRVFPTSTRSVQLLDMEACLVVFRSIVQRGSRTLPTFSLTS